MVELADNLARKLHDMVRAPVGHDGQEWDVLLDGIFQFPSPDQVANAVLEAACDKHHAFQSNIANTVRQLIVQAGANPLRLEHSLNMHSISTLGPCIRALVELETMGRGCRDRQGGNTLHHLVRNNSENTLIMLSQGVGLDAPHPDWFTQVQRGGKTFLHVLWTRVADSEFINREIWGVTRAGLRQGVALTAVDHAGRSVADLIAAGVAHNTLFFKNLEHGQPDKAAGRAEVMAQIEALRLETATPGNTAKPRSRL